MAISLVDALADDVLLLMCGFLEGSELMLGLGAAGPRAVRARVLNCAHLWATLCESSFRHFYVQNWMPR